MRDEDEDTRPLRFGASRGDRKPLGQQIRDDEDAYWANVTNCWDCSHQYPIDDDICPNCGAANANVDFNSALRQAAIKIDDDEAADAENWLRHMEEQTESKQ